MKYYALLLGLVIGFVYGAGKVCTAQTQERMWENPPVEEIGLLTEALIERVRLRPVPQAQLVQQENGAYMLEVNGEYYPFVLGATPLSDSMASWHVRTWAQTGHELVHVFANVAFYDPRRAYGDYHTPFWKDKNTYDEAMVETLLWRILRVHPEARILLTLQIDVYPDWHIENPDELMRNERGDGFVVGHHFQRVGNDPDRSKQEVLAPSFYSEKLLSDQCEAVRRFVRTVENCVPGRAVIGYVIGGNQDLQNYMWHPPNAIRAADPNTWGDYSGPARLAWQRWCRAKYVTPEALNEAWGTQYSDFASVEPPASESLVGGGRYHNPAREMRSVDWKYFLAQGRSAYILRLAGAVRNGSSRDIIVGTYSGESGCRIDVTDNYRLLRSWELDFLFHQPFYGDRLPPSPGGISAVLGSHQLNGRQFLCDLDHHTWLGRPLGKLKAGEGVSQTDRMVGRAGDIRQLRAMWRREIGQLLVEGLGWHYHPLHGAHMFEADSIREELSTLLKWAQATGMPDVLRPAADAAVIFDEHSAAFLREAQARLHWRWWHEQVKELNASGVPYRMYYADDLRAGKVPPAKVYLFVNQVQLDAKMVRAIETLKGEGRVLVFKQDVGYVQYSGGDADAVSSVVGMELGVGGTVRTDAERSMAKGHSLEREIEKVLPGGINPRGQGFVFLEDGLVVTDGDAAVLARYAGAGQAALAVREHGNWKSVFAGTDVLSAELFHAIAAYGGSWCVSEPGCVIAASDGMLMIHALEGGEREVCLKEAAGLEGCPPDAIRRSKSLCHRLKLKKGQTYLFRLAGD